MSRMDRDAILASLTERLRATAYAGDAADLTASQGAIVVAATPGEVPAAIARVKPLEGYRWLAINAADLFPANPQTLGTKIGIMDPNGRVLKAADLPRKR